MTSNLPVDTPVVEEPTATTTSAPASKKPGRPKAVQDTLEKLFQLYPQLFGAEFLPLKLGVFQDLMAKHPDEFEKATLKTALGLHTRSTRYLNAVASGLDRHDLDAKPVAATAPEHMYLAIIELHRRRQNKTKEDLIPKQQELFPDFDEIMDPNTDAPLSSLTIRDLAAIMLKKPVSQKKWLNDLIKS